MKKWTDQEIKRLRQDLLGWYDRAGRVLPWRVRPEDCARGVTADPYAVWLSEIMLQQTTVPHAAPYWQRFLSQFPTVTDLANADRELVMSMWAGLGYYARARNLHKCAQLIRDAYEGVFPGAEVELLKLPGIGPYTAAAIASICYNEATIVVDGNVERVMSRMAMIDTPLPKGKKDIRLVAARLADPVRPGDYSQALMDLGAVICQPRNPKCGVCVWSASCAAHAAEQEEAYPKKLKKKPLPKRFGAAFVLRSEDGYVLLERRADSGLLGGMLAFPGSPWGDKPQKGGKASGTNKIPDVPDVFILPDGAPLMWEKSAQPVRHVFTHFELILDVYSGNLGMREALEGLTSKANALDVQIMSERSLKNAGLPTVMKKVWTASQ